MEKYRKWTDEATGINPFIRPNKSVPFLTILLKILFILCKLPILLFLFPFVIGSLIFESIISNKSLHIFTGIPQSIFLAICGVWGCQDEAFTSWALKNNKGKLILSNSTCILEGLYLYNKLFPAVFLVISSGEDKCTKITGLSLLMRTLFQRQPFFNKKQEGQKIESALNGELKKGNNCVIFYEGIRTNGAATIKISSTLSNQIYNLGEDFCLLHSKYFGGQNIFSVVTHPFLLILQCLGQWRIGLKVRYRHQSFSSLHSCKQMQKQIDEFLLANGSKLLDTNPCEYFQFLEFYKKTHK